MVSGKAFLVVSYFPMSPLNSPKIVVNARTKDAEEWAKSLEDHPKSEADACLWLVDSEGLLAPAFVYDDAHEIYQHLWEWSEHKISDWFYFSIADNGNSYCIILMIKYEKTLERFNLRYKLMTMEDMPEGSKTSVYGDPLQIYVRDSKTWKEISSKIKRRKTIKLGFLDKRNFSVENFKNNKAINESILKWTEPIEVGESDSARRALELRMKET